MMSLFAKSEFLRESSRGARKFVTPGKSGKGKHDYVGLVLEKFFYSTPEFERSLESKKSRPNGWTLRGAWPSSGKHILDWEFDVWGERGGDVIVKVNLRGPNGENDGISYRANLATADRIVKKFVRWFQAKKTQMRKLGEANLSERTRLLVLLRMP